jgi:predicted RNase H-like nuclease (RuvC/YqgF family)
LASTAPTKLDSLQLKAAQDALQHRDARVRQLERELTSERGAHAAVEGELAQLKGEAAAMRDALQRHGLEVERARRASEDLEERLREEAQMRLGLVEKTEVRQLERALEQREGEVQSLKKKLAEGAFLLAFMFVFSSYISGGS